MRCARSFGRWATVVCALLGTARGAAAQAKWVGSWAAAQQVPEPANALPAEWLTDSTLRQIVHLSAGGTALRIHLSNEFGTEPLRIDSVRVARPVSIAGAKIDARVDFAVSFSGALAVAIPPGAEYVSDPVLISTAALADVAVTMHIEHAGPQQTGHPGSRATSYVAHGNVAMASDLPDAKHIDHWYFLSGVDVSVSNRVSEPAAFSVVILGDSITDGHAATTNGNDRWPDVLAARLEGSSPRGQVGVLNEGIGGNHLLTDGLGPNALARFDRDVLAKAGVRYLIVLEGVNDLGGLTRMGEVPEADHQALVRSITSAYEQIVLRAHAEGIQVYGATVLPYAGSDYYHPGPLNQQDLAAVNQWIRAAGHFDAVIDFDAVMRDPEHPDRLLPAYDSGDHLHPSPAGYKKMGETVPAELFQH